MNKFNSELEKILEKYAQFCVSGGLRGKDFDQALTSIKSLIRGSLPKEDIRKGVMPYEQGLIDGFNSCLARITQGLEGK